MKKVFILIFSLILYAVAGGLCGYYGIQFFSSYESIVIPMIWIMFSFYTSILIQVFIHELGHLIFGLLSGYQFLSIRFFNLMLINDNGHLRWKFLKIPGTLGQCLMTLDDFQQPYPFLLYHLGGALLNIISSILLFMICYLSTNPYIQSLSLALALFGIVTALGNAIPLSTGIDNDGKNVYNMLKHPVTQYACFQQLKIVEHMNQNQSLKDIDEKYFTIYSYEDLNYSLCMSITVLTCLRELDLGNYQKANDLAYDVLTHVQNISDHNRFSLKGILIYYLLCNQPQDSQIDILRDKKYIKMMKALSRDLTTLRIEYAYELLHQRDITKANQTLKKYNDAIKTHPYQGEIKSENRQIESIQHIYTKNDSEISI